MQARLLGSPHLDLSEIASSEVLRGSEEQRAALTNDLRRARLPGLLNVPDGLRACSLADALSANGERAFDIESFESTVVAAAGALSQRSKRFRLLDPSRFFVLMLPDGADDPGGFHSAFARGFDPYHRIGIGVLLNPSSRHSPRVSAAELARSYLHDSIHAATFMSWRLANVGSSWTPRREQYGINFKRPTGVSYSSIEATSRSPTSINLNLLMDGLNVLVVAQAMDFVIRQLVSDASREDGSVLADMRCDPDGLAFGSKHREFYFEVIEPTSRFIESRGGDEFANVVLEAMFSGKLRLLCAKLQAVEFGVGWRRRFMAPHWMQARKQR